MYENYLYNRLAVFIYLGILEMKILMIGSQVEQRALKVCFYKRTQVMALIIEFKALNRSIAKFSTLGAFRVTGRGQTYNDLYWM